MNPFIIAEVSANHLGDFDRAMHIVKAAADAGADAVKFQTWNPNTMCIDRGYTLDHGPWAGRSLFDLYSEAWTPWSWHRDLFSYAKRLGLTPFSAAFDRESVDFLESLGVDRHKVASFELTDIPLINYMASKGKPMILSTGMATADEIVDALEVVDGLPFTLLKCTSAYPADASDANLATIVQGDMDWGISDHSEGIGVAVAATVLGATMIEKHLTLSRKDGGPDAGFSMEPAEFKQMVVECRRAAAAIGKPTYAPGPNESTALRRSLWVSQEVQPGEELILGVNVVTARPELGLPPSSDLYGKVATRLLQPNTPLTQEVIG